MQRKAYGKRLKQLYMKKSTVVNQLHLKQSLYMLHMFRGTFITSQFENFDSIIMDFGSIDVKIEAEDKAMILLCSLSQSSNHLRETMFNGKEIMIELFLSLILNSI